MSARWLTACTPLVALLFVAGPATAFLLETNGAFAYTRSGSVAWRTDVDLETNSLVMRNLTITLGSTEIDVRPDTSREVQVAIQQWADDNRRFHVTMRTGANTGLNVTYKNPGFVLSVVQAGVITKTCAATVPVCAWTFANATSHTFSVLLPTTAEGLPSLLQPIVVASGGGTGAPSTSDAGGAGFVPLAEFPNPVTLFPQLSTGQWGLLTVGIVLWMNGTRLRMVLPLPARRLLAGPPPMFLFLGVTMIALAYLSFATASR